MSGLPMDCAQSAPTAVPGSMTAFRYFSLHFSKQEEIRHWTSHREPEFINVLFKVITNLQSYKRFYHRRPSEPFLYHKMVPCAPKKSLG